MGQLHKEHIDYMHVQQQFCLLQHLTPPKMAALLAPSMPHPNRTINLWHWWLSSMFAALMLCPSKKHQLAALLASYKATSKNLPVACYQQHWQCCLLQHCITPKNNHPAALLTSFDALSSKNNNLLVVGFCCLQQHWQHFPL